MEWLLRHGGIAENVPFYDCKSSDRKYGAKNYALGIVFIIYGIIIEVIYILVMIVMVRKHFRRLSCYKIMIVLGVYDMAAIVLVSLLTGYFLITGANYCTNSTLIYVTGAIALGLWCGSCMVCFILAVNRLSDLWSRKVMQIVFREKRTFLVLLLPLLYSLLFSFFTAPAIFNSDQKAWFFFTFVPGYRPDMFPNYPHTVNNLFIVVITCLIYVQYSRILFQHSRDGSALSWAQKSFFIQCFSICASNLVGAGIYVYMQFFPTSSAFVIVAHIGWQLNHGFPAIVYLLLNRTIQREVLTLLGLQKRIIINHLQSKPSVSRI